MEMKKRSKKILVQVANKKKGIELATSNGIMHGYDSDAYGRL